MEQCWRFSYTLVVLAFALFVDWWIGSYMFGTDKEFWMSHPNVFYALFSALVLVKSVWLYITLHLFIKAVKE
jgi:hypothetical protein